MCFFFFKVLLTTEGSFKMRNIVIKIYIRKKNFCVRIDFSQSKSIFVRGLFSHMKYMEKKTRAYRYNSVIGYPHAGFF
jgi:hypothetical protein